MVFSFGHHTSSPFFWCGICLQYFCFGVGISTNILYFTEHRCPFLSLKPKGKNLAQVEVPLLWMRSVEKTTEMPYLPQKMAENKVSLN